MATDARITDVELSFYDVPTATFGHEEAESDGTASWASTGVLVVRLSAGGQVGLGYAYTGRAAFTVARDVLAGIVLSEESADSGRLFVAMARAVRNLGWPGVSASALSAMDIALWDLKARILEVSLLRLLGATSSRVMAYGSGGFTSYSVPELQRQFSGWAEQGMTAVKMKVGSHPTDDASRVAAARSAIGTDVQLFVDANGAYSRKQALGFAERFVQSEVTWFEEPVSSDDLDGLRLIRDRGPAGMQIAAGEYGYTPAYFHAMLAAGAVDTLQADATRCGGVTGFASAAAQAWAAGIPLSAHTAPGIHATLGAALAGVVHVEYFHDHARIEKRFFDGLPALRAGELVPDADAIGHGLQFKEADAEEYRREQWSSS